MTRNLFILAILGLCLASCTHRSNPPSPSGTSCLAPFLAANAPTPRDVLIITIDTWRYDAAGFNAGAKVETPALDRLAAQGVVFENAFAHASLTLPSHASLLTGMVPYRHGLRDNAGFRLNEDIPTLASEFSRHGYATAAFISAFTLDARYGLNSGFDVYDDFIDAYEDAAVKVVERPAEATLARAQAWLEQNRERRAFTWIHLYEPHFPYEPPEPFATRYADRPYYGEVAFLDHLLDGFLSKIMDSGRPTTIVLTSDHGESLGEHGELTHGVFAYNATIHVPLLLWSPEWLNPGRVAAAVQLVDIAPTLMDLNRLESRIEADGISLLEALPAHRACYFESLGTHLNRGWAPLRGCIVDGKKAIDLPKPELYDLKLDPLELKNLAEPSTADFEACLSCLPDDLGLASRSTLSAEELEKLSALGYLAGDLPNPSSGGGDPKDLIHLDRMIHRAFALSGEGLYQQAIDVLEHVIVADPGIEIAYQHLSDFHHHLGDTEAAIAALEKARKAGISSELTSRKLALLYLADQRTDEALALLGPWADSEDPDTLAALGKAFSQTGRFEDARRFFERALLLDPSSSKIEADFGTSYLYAQQGRQAEVHFRNALKQNESNAMAWNGLGVVFSQQGNPEAAIDAWEKALMCDPDLAFCHFNLSVLYEKKGQLKKAVTHLKAYSETVHGAEKERVLGRLRALSP